MTRGRIVAHAVGLTVVVAAIVAVSRRTWWPSQNEGLSLPRSASLPQRTITARVSPDDVGLLGPRRFVVRPFTVQRNLATRSQLVDVTPLGEFAFQVAHAEDETFDMYVALEAWPVDDTWPAPGSLPTALMRVVTPQLPALRTTPQALAAPTSATGLSSLSDTELGALWSRWEQRVDAAGILEVGRIADDTGELVEWDAVLLEIGRRTGSEWTELLERRVPLVDGPPGNAGQLEIVTMLRRRRGQPDPLAIDVLPSSSLVVEFPETPRLHVRRTNVDVEHRELAASKDVEGNWQVEARGEDGLPLVPSNYTIGSVGSPQIVGDLRLRPGEYREEELAVTQWFHALPMGRTLVRVVHSDHVSLWGEPLITESRPLVLFHSASVEIDIRPRTVVADRSRVRELEEALRTIDTSKPIPVTREPLAWTDAWKEPPRNSTETLLQGGMVSLGVILRHLEDPDRTIAQESRMYGVLLSLTGWARGPWGDPIEFSQTTVEIDRDSDGKHSMRWGTPVPYPRMHVDGSLLVQRRVWARYRDAIVLRER